jgi:hypothetical protein
MRVTIQMRIAVAPFRRAPALPGCYRGVGRIDAEVEGGVGEDRRVAACDAQRDVRRDPRRVEERTRNLRRHWRAARARLPAVAAEGYVEWVTNGGVRFEHYGVRAVEDAVNHPDEPTENFPPFNVIVVENMFNSQIQQGTTNSSQTGSFSAGDLAALGQWATQVKEAAPSITELDEAVRVELEADARSLELKCRATSPNHGAVRELGKSVKNILEGATGSLIASGLISHVAVFARFFG